MVGIGEVDRELHLRADPGHLPQQGAEDPCTFRAQRPGPSGQGALDDGALDQHRLHAEGLLEVLLVLEGGPVQLHPATVYAGVPPLRGQELQKVVVVLVLRPVHAEASGGAEQPHGELLPGWRHADVEGALVRGYDLPVVLQHLRRMVEHIVPVQVVQPEKVLQEVPGGLVQLRRQILASQAYSVGDARGPLPAALVPGLDKVPGAPAQSPPVIQGVPQQTGLVLVHAVRGPFQGPLNRWDQGTPQDVASALPALGYGPEQHEYGRGPEPQPAGRNLGVALPEDRLPVEIQGLEEHFHISLTGPPFLLDKVHNPPPRQELDDAPRGDRAEALQGGQDVCVPWPVSRNLAYGHARS